MLVDETVSGRFKQRTTIRISVAVNQYPDIFPISPFFDLVSYDACQQAIFFIALPSADRPKTNRGGLGSYPTVESLRSVRP
jgi:hypothetical protein